MVEMRDKNHLLIVWIYHGFRSIPEGETSLETDLSPADPTNDSGVVGLIANYISKIDERLNDMEQNYASVQDQVSTLNKKILDVEKSIEYLLIVVSNSNDITVNYLQIIVPNCYESG